MSKSSYKKPIRKKHIALILVEGETDEEFYKKLSDKKFKGISKKIKNLKGNFNINKKIVDESHKYSNNNPNNTFDVYVCIDQEKINIPPLNKQLVLTELRLIPNFKKLYPVIAILMIESLFFIDIDGIYKFLRAKTTLRKPNKYKNFRRLIHQDLSKLFKQFNKTYYKGIRCRGFISALNLGKIINTAKELSRFVSIVKNRKNPQSVNFVKSRLQSIR